MTDPRALAAQIAEALDATIGWAGTYTIDVDVIERVLRDHQDAQTEALKKAEFVRDEYIRLLACDETVRARLYVQANADIVACVQERDRLRGALQKVTNIGRMWLTAAQGYEETPAGRACVRHGNEILAALAALPPTP